MKSIKLFELLPVGMITSFGRARRIFTNRFSILGWGEMPYQIPNKGAANAILSAYFLEAFEKKGLPTNYMGLFKNDSLAKLKSLIDPTNVMEISLLQRVLPQKKDNKYDYSIFKGIKSNFILPFKITYPLLEVETIFEENQRSIEWKDIADLTRFSDEEISNIKALTLFVNDIISKEFQEIGLDVENGTLEFGFTQNRSLVLLNSPGTFDENKICINGFPLGLKIAQIYYYNTKWGEDVLKAKSKNVHNWKELCKVKPPPLPDDITRLISNIYCACANEITKRIWFKKIPPIGYLCDQAEEMINCYSSPES